MSNNSHAKPLILTGLIIIITTAITIWFFSNFEYKEVDKPTGYSKEARKNDFLAAEYYLQKLGMEVTSNGNRARLLEAHDTNKIILLNNYGPKLSPTHFNNLKDWLKGGGHLIMKASRPSFTFFNIEIEDEDIESENIEQNQLLKEFNLYLSYVEHEESEESEENEVSNYVLNNGTQIDIEFNSSYYLFDPDKHANFTLENEHGIRLLQIKIGKGILTVLSDNSIFKNYTIENNDHAYLLSQLINTNANSDSEVLLLYSTESDSILTLLWRNAKQLCIAFLCMIFIALWGMYNRLGPIIPQISYNNRNIIEHLNAIARFSYRQDKGRYLLHKSRISCEQFFISRYPALKNMSTQERIDHLSDVLDIAPKNIHVALYTEPKSTHEYINSSHQLQKLWILK